MSSTWYLYLIRTKINSLYCGVTTDIERRFNEHQQNNNKTAKYLRGKQPLQLVWQYQAENKKHAMQLEWKIKGLTKHQKEQLCQMIQLPEFLNARSDHGKKNNSLSNSDKY